MAGLAAVSTRDHAEFNPHFQVGLDVAGRRCLVIGGGAEAGDKTGRLLQAGAAVVVVAPELNAELRAWAAAGRIRHCPRRYRRGDLRGAVLVLNTVRSDAPLCRRVFAQARRRRIPINTYDLPQYSTVAMAALAACGHLRVSISTSNAAPALAGRLRRDLETIFESRATGGEAAAFSEGTGDEPTRDEPAGSEPAGRAAPGGEPAGDEPTGGEPAGGKPTDGDPAGSELEQFLDGLGRLRVLAKERAASAAERRALLRAQVKGFRLAGTVHLPPEWRQRLAAARRELKRRPPR